MKILPLAAIIALLTSCVSHQTDHNLAPLQTVAKVDLERYVGLWYEIARYPNSFQKNCRDSTAMYTARQDGTIEVINRCQSTKDDRMREAKGRAWVVDPGTNTRLKVSFFWPFKGDYWIIELGQDYDYAVVGTPNRKYLWLLSRSPQMAPEVLAKIIENVERQGFDGTKLVFD